MKNMQLLGEQEEAEAAAAARWKRLCLAELGGLKRLRRKSREPARHRPGAAVQRDRPGQQQHVPGLEGEAGASQAALDGGGAFPPAARLFACPPPQQQQQQQQQQRPPGPEDAACVRPDGQLFPERSLPSRMVACPPPPQESGYSPAGYGGHHRAASPSSLARKRPAEAAGPASELKAVQQTRRLLANARERTRVHTISAAFEALRKQVPCYSYGQKLSKLAILRIACNYILSLARLADLDYSADHSNMSFSECVEQCTRTLQAEGRSKKRKE